MTEVVANFIRTNKSLLTDTGMTEFFHSAYNGLTTGQQKELVSVLDEAGIETLAAREVVLRFILTMDFEVLERPITLTTYIRRYVVGRLGFDENWLHQYILDNSNEWDVKLEQREDGSWLLVPQEFAI